MVKHEELLNPRSCLRKAMHEEWLFTLLSRDPASAHTIREWVKERIRLGLNSITDEQISNALKTARMMEIQAQDVDFQFRLAMHKKETQ